MNINSFEKNNVMKISLISKNQIHNISYGRIKNSKTLNYKNFKPERGGLFCERIFGSSNEQCICGRTFSYDNFNFVCKYCKVETTLKGVNLRRDRMGHIDFSDRFINPLYLNLNPCYLSIIMGFSKKEIKNLIYNNHYLVLHSSLKFINLNQILNFNDYIYYKKKYFNYFYALTGIKSIYYFINNMDIDYEIFKIKNYFKRLKNYSNPEYRKKIKRYEILMELKNNNINFLNIFFDKLLILPPDLRPIVKLPDETIVSSDLNELYKRVINSNIRLKKFKKFFGIPDDIIQKEKYMTQQRLNDLFLGGGKNVENSLKSIIENLKGKSGFFRNNLLGKRVDYSGRCVIVSGSNLKFGYCSIPKKLAAELFRPFIYHEILKNKDFNIKSAKFEVDKLSSIALAILYKLIKEFYIILNRAPTLHKLNVQSFKIILNNENAIKLHPLVCAAFNADFDGDQMAVHIPISTNSKVEFKTILFSGNNVLYPANGSCCISPTKDISLGIYCLSTIDNFSIYNKKTFFNNFLEALSAFNYGYINLNTLIFIRFKKIIKGYLFYKFYKTTLGRIIIFNIFSFDFNYNNLNKILRKNDVSKILDFLSHKSDFSFISSISDNLMRIGFNTTTIFGSSICIDDMIFNYKKKNILNFAKKILVLYNLDYLNFFLSRNSKKKKILDLWELICNLMSNCIILNLNFSNYFDKNNLVIKSNSINSIYMMMDSGARGSENQIKQICSNRGLISYKNSGVFQNPVLSSLREGLNVFEYFYFSHNSRKTLADTALKTASAGYLTRRLVEVSNNVFISEFDCKSKKGIVLKTLINDGDIIEEFYDRIFGRVLLKDIFFKKLTFKKNTLIDDDFIVLLKETKINSLSVRSPLKCKSKKGVCSLCYGINLSKNKIIDIGEMVGITAAQSIGEPGTQLTMRTFHTGGAINKYIKKSFYKSNTSGFLKYSNSLKYILNSDNFKVVISKFSKIKIFNNLEDKEELEFFNVPYSSKLLFDDKSHIEKGSIICKWDSENELIISEFFGFVKLNNFHFNLNYIKRIDIDCYEIINTKFYPSLDIYNEKNDTLLKTYSLRNGDLVLFNNNDKISLGDIIIKKPYGITIAGDIIGSLPKIDNLFEARKPKNSSLISPVDGVIKLGFIKKKCLLSIVDCSGKTLFNAFIPSFENLIVFENQFINKGECLTSGDLNPHDILFLKGFDYFVEYFLREIKSIYFSQAVKISDKHIEIIISQMLKFCIVVSPGASLFLSGQIIFLEDIKNFNKNLRNSNKIKYELVLTGITNKSLKNKSFLSSASFQKTSTILSGAAMFSKIDDMTSLKNIIMTGEVFPAGSGMYKKILSF